MSPATAIVPDDTNNTTVAERAPTVTVIVPVYNEERTIDEILRRVLGPVSDVILAHVPEGIDCELTRTSGRYQMTVSTNGNLPSGLFCKTVYLEVRDDRGQTRFHQPVDVCGRINEKVIALPPSIQIGAIGVGQFAEHVITLHPMQGEHIASVKTDPWSDTTILEQKQIADSWQVRFRHTVSGIGAQNHLWRFQVQLASKEVVTVAIAISSHGLRTGQTQSPAQERSVSQ